MKLLAGVVAVALSCGGTDDTQDGLTEKQASVERASCRYVRGALPAETLGQELPQGDAIPIEHFILLMQENRSFDHYFGKMPGVDGLSDDAANPDAKGNAVPAYHETAYSVLDTVHGWTDSHLQYNDGAMDGFVVTNDPGGSRAMAYFTDADLPFYWDLYQTFAISDRHFCSVLGPTWLNRFYYLSATSAGSLGSELQAFPESDVKAPYSIFQLLDDADIDWRIYEGNFAFAEGAYPQYMSGKRERVRSFDMSFFDDLAAGELPPVTFVDPSFYINDEHPPTSPQTGEEFMARIIRAVMSSAIWPTVAIVLTYDEHGGFYDHFPPPEACQPDGIPPALEEGDFKADFDRFGFRVPLVVVSPFAKAAYVSHEATDLTSVLRLLEAKFGLQALSARDANSWPMLDLFDFKNPPFVTPPSLVEAALE